MPKYFFAILPSTIILNEIIDFQKEIEASFGSVHAQKTPPHVTIIPPFHCEEEQLQDFIEKISLFLNDTSIINLKIHLVNFQRFEGRTLFIDIAKNESFEKLCKGLKLLFNQQKIIKQRVEKHFFIPHITIANKDIKKRDFKVAWEDFKARKYQRSFGLESLAVLELIEKKWEVKTTVAF
ncbi:MAG: 2'-5' RNA ligase [Vicingaceae bacterium]|jgi:2'-5' RNA ligase